MSVEPFPAMELWKIRSCFGVNLDVGVTVESGDATVGSGENRFVSTAVGNGAEGVNPKSALTVANGEELAGMLVAE